MARRAPLRVAGLNGRSLLLAIPLVLICHTAFAAAPEGTELFESKVRPIFFQARPEMPRHDKQWSGLDSSCAAALTGGDTRCGGGRGQTG